jgi:hypothetical protein
MIVRPIHCVFSVVVQLSGIDEVSVEWWCLCTALQWWGRWKFDALWATFANVRLHSCL